nr:S26 family signal peptidase [Sphingomonas sp.]
MSRRRRATDAPLLDWGAAQPSARALRSQLVRRMAITGAGIAAVLVSAALPPAPRLVWNASASAPVGLYTIMPGAWVEPGDMVLAWPPARYRRLAAGRRYLPINVPLVKRVAAYGGDKVCARGQQIFVNGRKAAVRRSVDGKGRPPPTWSGCVRLHGRQLFLLNDNPASFDGRYFGVTDGQDVIGTARLLWRR